MSELKPCPFCGGEAKLLRLSPVRVGKRILPAYQAVCSCCNASVGDGVFAAGIDEAEVIGAWNTRAERTCDIEGTATDGLCTDDPKKLFHLSCGHNVMLCGLDRKPNYCAVCGAKVVER